MELCSHNHEEICFSGRNCPVCELIDDHNDTVRSLKEKIETLEHQVEEELSIASLYKEKWVESQTEVNRLCKGQIDGER